jgi:hypothetical protein
MRTQAFPCAWADTRQFTTPCAKHREQHIAEEDVAVAGVCGVNLTQIAVAATALPRQRTVLVEVSSDGYVIGVRPLSEQMRQRDS